MIYLMFVSNILNAQIDSLDNLDIDFGFPKIRLESSCAEVKSTFELRSYDCDNCGLADSVVKEYHLNGSKGIIIDNIDMEVRGLHFVDDSLFKINMVFGNNIKNKNKNTVLFYFLSKYGKETKHDNSTWVWETSKTYLFLNLPEYNSYGNNLCYILIYSKRFDKIRAVYLKNLDSLKPKNRLKIGKGNGTFIPDVSYSIKLINMNSSISDFEKLLPDFTLNYSDTLFKYNKESGKYVIFSSVRNVYSFIYRGINVSAEVDIKKAKIINKIEYYFRYDPAIRFAVQRQKNGLIINETMTRIVTKMGFNKCIVYDNIRKIHLTEYNEKHFKIEKY